jgi:predicted dehydrogenase
VINVGIIGCGVIGQKRANAISGLAKIKYCLDLSVENSSKFSKINNCLQAFSVDEILKDSEVNLIVIATRHDSLADLSKAVIESGKNLLVEKPGALNSLEFEKIIISHKNSPKTKIHVGYNHQFHPAILKAKEICKSEEFGKIMFLRGRYGHGGRIGYESEWRATKSLSGGGELIDQGSHLIDLAITFLGELKLDYASTPTYYWDMDVEDNVFMSLKNQDGAIAFLHASCTEWKNMFSLEIYGEKGKIEISGLGGSYGQETITFYRMKPEMGPPESQTWQFSGGDESWRTEFEFLLKDIGEDSNFSNNVESSATVLKLIDDIYLGSER